jgi:hypothetical protein
MTHGYVRRAGYPQNDKKRPMNAKKLGGGSAAGGG